MVEPSSQFLEENLVSSIQGVKSEFGFGKVRQSGNLNMTKFLNGFRDELEEGGLLLREMMKYNELELLDDGVKYRNAKAKRIIFCEGHESLKNPWFDYLPFRETKGEVLIIRAKGWNPGGIVHNKINIVPMEDDLFWVGSTFDWEDKDLRPTEKAKNKLLEQLHETLDCSFEILEHKAGIRPTVKDRRPILGQHPKEKQLYIFNGQSTRGVMLAPYFAKEMADYQEKGKNLDREVDVTRFSESA